MIALSIIAIVIGLASVAVGVILVFRISALYGDMEKLAKWQGELENNFKGLKQAVNDLEKEQGEVIYPNLEGVVYDEKTTTMTVKGNIQAQGWISAGTKKK